MLEWVQRNTLTHLNSCSYKHLTMQKGLIYFIFLSGVCFAVILSFLGDLHKFIFPSNSNQIVGETVEEPCNKHLSFLSKFIKDSSTNYQTSLTPSVQKDKRDLTGEALASLHLAKEMWEHGKHDKAMKIYQHAIKLDPSHPDILNEYGEFLEKTQQDVVKAEHLYCRALVQSPKHSKALSNRKRTLPLVEEIDQSNFNRIERKRDTIIKIPDNHPGLRRMKRESYFQHIHHTTAIEGNTFTLSQTRSFVETRIVISGKSIMEHNEILGMDAALHYVNSTLVHRIGEISSDDILDIQKRVLGFVDPIGAGQFRTTQVFVGEHIPPAASELDKLMKELIEWLNSDEALSLHPIEFSALAHYKLVFIHPFYDGNGRTSRLLMNLILMQAGYPPIIIRKEEKQEYYNYLETANAGDIRPFIRFIAKCTERTLDEYIWATSENAPSMTSIFVMDDHKTIILDPADIINEELDVQKLKDMKFHDVEDNDFDRKPVDRKHSPGSKYKEPTDNDINNNDENNNGEELEGMPSFTSVP